MLKASRGICLQWATMLTLCLVTAACPLAMAAEDDAVRISEQTVTIPTYQMGPADPNPIFYLNESYLGNLLFDLQPAQAIQFWEQAKELDPSLGIVHRNLGWAYYRNKRDIGQAIQCYEQAIACKTDDPRWFLELDALYEFANVSPQKRHAVLQANHATVVQRQDSLIREITVLVAAGVYETAIRYLTDHRFNAQEGREEIHDVYVDAHLLQGLRCLEQSKPDQALQHFLLADEYPENLSVGRPENDPRAAQVSYLTGLAYAEQGQSQAARQAFRKAADQTETKRWPEARFYQARSLAALGEQEAAIQIYADLMRLGRQRLEQDEEADFFAKFGQQETRRTRAAEARFILGLGLLGADKMEPAKQEFDKAQAMNLSHVWATYYAQACRNRSVLTSQVEQ